MKHTPSTLYVEMTSVFPRWVCYVTDRRGTANGGFFRGFRSHADMWAWLDKHDYAVGQ